MSNIIEIINGPNLNMLGLREPALYGSQSLADVEALCRRKGAPLGLTVECRQSNHEGELIDWIHSARGRAAGIVINPGGLTHTSVVLHDALKAAELPVIEVHLSNVHQREDFRHFSYVSLVARGVIAGLGSHGYEMAIDALYRLTCGEQR